MSFGHSLCCTLKGSEGIKKGALLTVLGPVLPGRLFICPGKTPESSCNVNQDLFIFSQ